MNKNNYFLHKLEQLPIVSPYAKTRGWPYIIAWCHRLIGVILVFYACFHVYTLSLLETPAQFNAKMQIFGSPLFLFFEWLLAVPVIFHALNGGRLILYECFGNAMLATIVRMMDPREKEKKERLKILYSDQGLYRCHSSQACSFVCPKEIEVAHFMALAKAGEFSPD